MRILFAGCLLLSISSVLTRPDVSHLGESQKLDNQYATLDAGDGSGRVEGRGASASSSNQETREEVAEGVPEWLSIEKSHLATEQDNGNGMLHNYGDLAAVIKSTGLPGRLEGDSATAATRIDLRSPLLPPTVYKEEEEHGNERNQMPQTSTGDLLSAEGTFPKLSYSTKTVEIVGAGEIEAAAAPAVVVEGVRVASSSDVASNRIGNLRRTIPGEPNVDYPIFSQPPQSSFRCTGRHDGYYADVEARCQVFRVCANTDLTGQGFAFLCPNGTLFNQRFFVCDWYNNVDCPTSEQFYDRNEDKHIMDHEQMMEKVKQMIQFPLTQPFMANQITTTTTTTVVTVRPVSTGLPTTSHNFTPRLLPTSNTTPGAIPVPVTPFFGHSLPATAPTEHPLRLPNVLEKDLLPPGDTYPGNRAIVDTFTTTTTSRPFQETYKPLPPVQPSVLPSALVTPRIAVTPSPPPAILPVSEDDTDKENTNAVTQNEQKVYVSSLGELSTDVNSGFDINKSKFLVVAGDTNGEVGGGRTEEEDQRITAEKERLEKILEEQVALVGQSININGLTQQAQINSALLASTNRFATPSKNTPFLPRLIASNVIVPLPKGFSKNKKQGDNQSLERLKNQQQQPSLSSLTERPTYTASEFGAGTSGQFPAERFSFPAAGHLHQLSLLPPEAPAPFTDPPLLVQFAVDGGYSTTANPLPMTSTGQSQTDLGLSSTVRGQPASTLASRLDEVAHRGERISLSSSFQVDPLKEQQGNNDDLVENVNEKQIFTYPFAAKSQEEINYSDEARLSIFVPDQNLQGPREGVYLSPEDKGEADTDEEDTAVAGSENDQQIANSAVNQIVYRPRGHVKYGQPQQVLPSPYASKAAAGVDGHVPRAQSRAFTVSDDDEESEFPEGNRFYSANNGHGSYHNFNTINATPLPRILPSVTQQFQQQQHYQQHGQYSNGGREGYGVNRNVEVKIVPALGFALNDPKEREAYYEAVSRGLLGENGAVYVNKVQGNQFSTPSDFYSPQTSFNNLLNFNEPFNGYDRNSNNIRQGYQIQDSFSRLNLKEGNLYNNQHLNHLRFNFGGKTNNNLQQQQGPLVSNVREEEGYDIETRPSIFKGSSSYTVPINSVGRLENDSDSVSGQFNFHQAIRRRRKSKMERE